MRTCTTTLRVVGRLGEGVTRWPFRMIHMGRSVHTMPWHTSTDTWGPTAVTPAKTPHIGRDTARGPCRDPSRNTARGSARTRQGHGRIEPGHPPRAKRGPEKRGTLPAQAPGPRIMRGASQARQARHERGTRLSRLGGAIRSCFPMSDPGTLPELGRAVASEHGPRKWSVYRTSS